MSNAGLAGIVAEGFVFSVTISGFRDEGRWCRALERLIEGR